MKVKELENGKIYFISYGSQTQLVGRVRDVKTTDINFYEYLHYWNGSETFNIRGYCIKSAIEEIREASQAEKMTLLKFAIENNTI